MGEKMNKELRHKIKVLQASINRTHSHMQSLYSELDKLLQEAENADFDDKSVPYRIVKNTA